MFTIKYRLFQPAAEQPQEGPTHYDQCEQIHGPFSLVSQEMDDGYTVIYAHRGDDPGMTFGPCKEYESGKPRPILWVMNESGATVATYHL